MRLDRLFLWGTHAGDEGLLISGSTSDINANGAVVAREVLPKRALEDANNMLPKLHHDR